MPKSKKLPALSADEKCSRLPFATPVVSSAGAGGLRRRPLLRIPLAKFIHSDNRTGMTFWLRIFIACAVVSIKSTGFAAAAAECERVLDKGRKGDLLTPEEQGILAECRPRADSPGIAVPTVGDNAQGIPAWK